MVEQKFIGVVMSVSNELTTVLLDANISSLKREIGGKNYSIGQIGTYVLVPTATLC